MANLNSINFSGTTFTIPTVTVDSAFSTTSENPVQNKVVAAKVDSIDASVSANTFAIEVLNGDDTTAGSVAKAIKDAIDNYVPDTAPLEARLDAAEAALDTLNGDDTTTGSVAKTVKDAIATVVDNAPAAFDTLKEVADWIANDTTGAAALAAKIATLETKVETLEALLANYEEIILSMTDGTDTVNKMILAKPATT